MPTKSKTLDSKDVDYDETPYQDVKSYIELTTDNGKPLFTLLTTNNISKKISKMILVRR